MRVLTACLFLQTSLRHGHALCIHIEQIRGAKHDRGTFKHDGICEHGQGSVRLDVVRIPFGAISSRLALEFDNVVRLDTYSPIDSCNLYITYREIVDMTGQKQDSTCTTRYASRNGLFSSPVQCVRRCLDRAIHIWL